MRASGGGEEALGLADVLGTPTRIQDDLAPRSTLELKARLARRVGGQRARAQPRSQASRTLSRARSHGVFGLRVAQSRWA